MGKQETIRKERCDRDHSLTVPPELTFFNLISL